MSYEPSLIASTDSGRAISTLTNTRRSLSTDLATFGYVYNLYDVSGTLGKTGPSLLLVCISHRKSNLYHWFQGLAKGVTAYDNARHFRSNGAKNTKDRQHSNPTICKDVREHRLLQNDPGSRLSQRPGHISVAPSTDLHFPQKYSIAFAHRAPSLLGDHFTGFWHGVESRLQPHQTATSSIADSLLHRLLSLTYVWRT